VESCSKIECLNLLPFNGSFSYCLYKLVLFERRKADGKSQMLEKENCMKKIVFVMAGICAIGCMRAEIGAAERGASALKLLQSVPEILLKDVPEVASDLTLRQSNLSILKGNIKKQKEKAGEDKKKLPVTDIMITTYLALSEFKDVVDIFIYVVEDIFQNKLILPIATMLGQTETDANYIGKYLNKVKDVLKNASSQLKEFLAIQNLMVVLMDTSLEKLAAQRNQLVKPVG
jgi:hypothetical protein